MDLTVSVVTLLLDLCALVRMIRTNVRSRVLHVTQSAECQGLNFFPLLPR